MPTTIERPNAQSRRSREKTKPSAPSRPSRNPKPWETVVRIRVIGDRSTGFGSGTVIYSTPEESLILTCAHIFKLDGRKPTPPSQFPRRIMIDLFDGKLEGTDPAQVHFAESVEGKAVDYDFTLDVGLIRMRPGRQLPASRVVPASWDLQVADEGRCRRLPGRTRRDGRGTPWSDGRGSRISCRAIRTTKRSSATSPPRKGVPAGACTRSTATSPASATSQSPRGITDSTRHRDRSTACSIAIVSRHFTHRSEAIRPTCWLIEGRRDDSRRAMARWIGRSFPVAGSR